MVVFQIVITLIVSISLSVLLVAICLLLWRLLTYSVTSLVRFAKSRSNASTYAVPAAPESGEETIQRNDAGTEPSQVSVTSDEVLLDVRQLSGSPRIPGRSLNDSSLHFWRGPRDHVFGAEDERYDATKDLTKDLATSEDSMHNRSFDNGNGSVEIEKISKLIQPDSNETYQNMETEEKYFGRNCQINDSKSLNGQEHKVQRPKSHETVPRYGSTGVSTVVPHVSESKSVVSFGSGDGTHAFESITPVETDLEKLQLNHFDSSRRESFEEGNLDIGLPTESLSKPLLRHFQ